LNRARSSSSARRAFECAGTSDDDDDDDDDALGASTPRRKPLGLMTGRDSRHGAQLAHPIERVETS